jgi:hypothetical protein
VLLVRDHRTSFRRILSVLSAGGETKRNRAKHEHSWLTAISDAGSTPAASTIHKLLIINTHETGAQEMCYFVLPKLRA